MPAHGGPPPAAARAHRPCGIPADARCLPVAAGRLLGRADNPGADAADPTAATNPAPPQGQRGGGLAYEMAGSAVWDVADPACGRVYQVFVALPTSYAQQPERRYPVLHVTDADYGFPVIRQISRRLNDDGQRLQDFILVGLSHAVGEDGMPSRRRDYTPSLAGTPGAPPDAVFGQGAAYIDYLRRAVLPSVAHQYRSDELRRLFLGHSFGGLLGARMLFTAPDLFSGYILGSPSLWYDNHLMNQLEARYAKTHRDLDASV